jgi:hypothetical protein
VWEKFSSALSRASRSEPTTLKELTRREKKSHKIRCSIFIFVFSVFHSLPLSDRRNNDLFISCLMQASFDYVSKYVLEVAVRKSSANKILGVELINRNEIYCLESTSWRVI